MAARLRIVGVILIVVGLISWGAAGYAFLRVQDGNDALQGFSDAQDVALSYNDEGELIDRGSTEAADEILALLGDTWRWPVDQGELDPDDPVVNTGTEYMYQMATIAFHVLEGDQTVVVAERTEWDGDGDGSVTSASVITPESLPEGRWDPATASEDAVFMPGTYTVPVNGRYWTGFDRSHPLDGQAREQAWNGTVHGLFAELGVGATTASSLQMGLGIVGVTALMGLGFVVSGGGLLWVGMATRRDD